MVEKYFKHEIVEMSILVIYIIFIIGSLSLFFLFGGGGIERVDILTKNNFYIPYGVSFLIGIIAIKVIGLFIFSKKEQKIDGSIIHDPDQSFLGSFTIISNPFLLGFGSIVIFSLLLWFFTSQQVFFNATPQFEQKFTVGADLFFAVYPASPSETLGALFLISLYGLILGILFKKGKLPFWLFILLFILGSILLSGIFGVINHWARYGFNDVAIQNVIFFWSFGGFITAITGSVIPFLVMHDLNNFFFRINELFSNDVIAFITFSIIGILVLSFIFVYFKIRSRNSQINKKIK